MLMSLPHGSVPALTRRPCARGKPPFHILGTLVLLDLCTCYPVPSRPRRPVPALCTRDPVSRDFPLKDRATPVPSVVANIHVTVCRTEDRRSPWRLWGGVWPVPWDPTPARMGTLDCVPGQCTRWGAARVGLGSLEWGPCATGPERKDLRSGHLSGSVG